MLSPMKAIPAELAPEFGDGKVFRAVIDYQAETIVKHHRKALGNVTCAPSARELPTRGLHG